MRKVKEQKGITLIALIITIIVLLILAVVAISAVKDDGIINYAQNAKQQYEEAEVNESTTLKGYLDKIKENVPTGTGTSTGEDEEGTPISFKIGGTEYQATSNQTWAQWCEGRNDYLIRNGMVSKVSDYQYDYYYVKCANADCERIQLDDENTGVCDNCGTREFFIGTDH